MSESQNSAVRGLVVRCLLFNPECSCSNPCVCANFLNNCFEADFHFFGTMRLPPFGFVPKLFKCPQGVLPSFFWYFATERMLKNSKGSLLSDFSALWTVENSHFLFFLAKFFKSCFNFLKFCNRMDVKKSQSAPLLQFSAL